MALSDPLVIEMAGSDTNVPRTGADLAQSTYRTDDGTAEFSIIHRPGRNGRKRTEVRFAGRKIEPDPLFPSTNKPYSASVYLVIDRPEVGYTTAELQAGADMLFDLLTRSSGANLTKIIEGQH